MMKTTVKQVALVALFLCFSSAEGLQCMSCSDVSCSSQTSVNCSSQQQCLSTSASDFYQTFSFSGIDKRCASSVDCSAARTQAFSYTLGSYSFLSNTSCCDSDNCNSANITNWAPPAGSLQCYSCDPLTFECSNVTCASGQLCAHVTFGDGSETLYGCFSQNLCGLSEVFDNNTFLTCCNTSNCNDPGLGLQCMTCTDASCSSQYSVLCSTTTCYSEFFSVFSRSENITSPNIYIFKGCGTPNIRPDTEGQFVSFNYGPYSLLTNTTRCDTDNCNSANITMEPPAGSLQCYGCDPNTFKCTNVSCNSEEVCASVHYNSKVFYGCVSENLCEKNSSLPQQFFYNPQLVSCCNTSYCIVPPSRPTVPGVYTTVPGLPTTVPPGQTTTATHCDEDEDSVFCAAGPGLSLRWFISLMGFCIFTHTLFF